MKDIETLKLRIFSQKMQAQFLFFSEESQISSNCTFKYIMFLNDEWVEAQLS